MIELTILPHVTAGLNALAAMFLGAGFGFVRAGNKAAHKACMLTAVAVSVLFLVVYVSYHLAGGFAKFGGEGPVRLVYFSILIGHVVLAAVIVPMVPVTLFLALRGRSDRHRRWARWTLPLWFFVSISGVIVYAMTIHLYPYANG